MTRRILLAITASVLLVIVAFLVPLWVFIGDFAVDRGQREAVLKLQPLISSLSGATAEESPELVEGFIAQTGLATTVYYPDGTVVGSDIPRDRAVDLALEGGAFFTPRDDGRDLLAPLFGVPGTAGQIVVVRMHVPEAQLTDRVVASRLVLLGLGVVLLALAVLVGLLLARSFLRPIRQLTDTAEAMAAGDLAPQPAPDSPPEIRNVGIQLNRLATRVTELLRGEREQVADLAHRLRTPVTALKLDADQVREAADRERLTDDVDRLERMVDEVIREARRPVREGARAVCDAAAVVRDRATFWGVLAEDQGRAVRLDVPSEPVLVRLDAADLGDALDALLGNVFAHTPEGTGYEVRVRARAGAGARLTVADDGPGLPDADVLARGASGAGSTGLGLDIARRTAESSGGALLLETGPGGGTTVTLDLGPPV